MPRRATTIILVLPAAIALLATAAITADTTEYQKALDLYNSGRHKDAIAAFRKVVATDPALAAAAQLQVATVCREQGMLDDAIQAYKYGFTIAKLPQDHQILVDLRKGLVTSYCNAELWNEAEEVIAKLQQESPEDGDWLLVDYCILRSEVPKALATAKAALSRYKDSPTAGAHIAAATERFFVGTKIDDLKAFVAMARQANPEFRKCFDTEAYKVVLCAILERIGEVDEAVSVVTELRSGTGTPEDRARCMREVGAVYYRNRRYSDAIRALTEELGLIGDQSEYATRCKFMLGLCHKEQGNTESASRYMREVAALRPGSHMAKQAERFLESWTGSGKAQDKAK